MSFLLAILGLLLIIAGRKLYWLFVAVVGFLVGYTLSNQLLSISSVPLQILVGLVGASLGAILAIFLQRLAIIAAGFLAGGYIINQTATLLEINRGDFSWIPFLIGGILGVILAATLFDWALIILSSLIGAALVSTSLKISETWMSVLYFVLLLLGLIIQGGTFRREKK